MRYLVVHACSLEHLSESIRTRQDLANNWQMLMRPVHINMDRVTEWCQAYDCELQWVYRLVRKIPDSSLYYVVGFGSRLILCKFNETTKPENWG